MFENGLSENHCIRWMVRRDMPDVRAIERSAESDMRVPMWSYEEYVRHLRQRDVIGVVLETPVADNESKVVACALYRLGKSSLEVMRILTHADYRRHGYATAMIKRLERKLSIKGRQRVLCVVDGDCLDVCALLSHCGWYVVAVTDNSLVFEITLERLGQSVIDRILNGDCRVR